MEFNLLMVNLWIGLCRGVAGLPPSIRQLGYEDKWIEQRIVIAKDVRVKPDFIMASKQLSHCAVFEWKSGANTESKQLERYARVQTNHLIRFAYLDTSECSSHEVIIVGKEEYSDRLQIGLKENGHVFPLLQVGPSGLARVMNDFLCEELASVFNPDLEIDWGKVPTSFIPFDAESPDWEVAEQAVRHVVSHMMKRSPRIQLKQLASQICEEAWSIMSREAQDETCRVIHRVLRNGERNELRGYFTTTDNPTDGYVNITGNPLNAAPERHTAEFGKLSSLQEKFLARLKKAGGDSDMVQGRLL